MLRAALAALGAYGFLVSATATRNIRAVRREAQAGDKVAEHHFTQSRYARVFGPRNSDLGMVFYALLHVTASTGLIRRRPVLAGLLCGSALSLGTSLYLLWALFTRLHVWCPICMRGHIVNVATFVTLSKMWRAVTGREPEA
ncbi:MAG: hypothetical protein NVS2B16_12470 [Chloroflexota bacterium]